MYLLYEQVQQHSVYRYKWYLLALMNKQISEKNLEYVLIHKYLFDLETQQIVSYFIERMLDSVVAQIVSVAKGKPKHFAQLLERIVTA